MQYLAELIDRINNEFIDTLKEGADKYHFIGITKEIKKEGKKHIVTYDKEPKPVVIDDKFEVYAYHKIGVITADPGQKRGRRQEYRLTAECRIICNSKKDYIHDQLVNILCNQDNIIYKSSDFDSFAIIKRETDFEIHNWQDFLFEIKYQIIEQTSCNLFQRC